MSVSKPRRPRIPSAFMPPDWSPPPSPSTQSVEARIEDSPNPGTDASVLEGFGSASQADVFPPTSFSAESHAKNPTGNSIRTNLRQLKQRQVELRRAKAAQVSECEPTPPVTSPEPPSPPSSIRSVVPSPSEVFASPPVQPTSLSGASSPAASLRSVRESLRGLKERQAAIRKEREAQRLAAEETARIHANQHRTTMLRLCALEEQSHSARWARVLKVDSMEGILRFAQLPWPVLPPLVCTPQDITKDGIARFLLCAFRQPHLSEREKLKEELDRWADPDFDSRVLIRVQDTHRSEVTAGRTQVCAALKRLMEDLDS